MIPLRKLWTVPAAALLLAACSEDSPVAPVGPDSGAGASELLACEIDVTNGSLSCDSPGSSLGDGALGAILGGQGIYVELGSNNVAYDAGTEIFSAAVSIRNLTDQVLGSNDGASPAADGIRIFFVNDPQTTGGTGTVTVANADGTAEFSTAGQPYYQYTQALAPGRTSLPRIWEWNVPSTVTSFSFLVGVGADIQDEPALQPGFNARVESISADSLHTCALDLSGQAYCWGHGAHGRLGNGETEQQSIPVAVHQGSLRFVSIGTGLSFTCGLEFSGDAYCWGSDTSGRLGNGGNGNSSVPGAVIGGHKFVQLTVGRSFACGLTAEGQAWCWGGNSNGNLGNGTTENSPEPVQVSQDGLVFATIAAGSFHTCAITPDQETYCWGSNSNSKLGLGEYAGEMITPIRVAGDQRFTSVYPTQQHTCALTEEGEAWCWGSNGNGKLGDATGETQNAPSLVATDVRFASLTAGNNHTCGVAFDGKGYCWGSNGRSKLGTGESGAKSTPFLVAEVENFSHITAGSDHTCGATTDGKVYCWGNADNGRLGNGVTSNSNIPLLVTGLEQIAFSPALSAPYGQESTVEANFRRLPLAEHLLATLEGGRATSNLI